MSLQRGRFAPSPTGELHLGNARTALLSWLWARKEGGEWAMRVEDLDRPRVRPGLADQQLDELRWLGLRWDGQVVRQSDHSTSYDEALARLPTYRCVCSRAEIAAASAPHAGEETRYPGTCRDRGIPEGRPAALRLRVPDEWVEFHDEILGPQRFHPQQEIGDFVLKRADGIHAYQLAVVVDDAAMGITQVLRGADLLSSTARQLLLYRMLQLAPPRWAHAPLVVGPSGERLSKRDRSTSLSSLRAAGIDPRQLIAQLASISGIETGLLACSPEELVSRFDLARVPRAAATVFPRGA